MLELPAATLAPLVARIKVISKMDIAERRLPQDGHFNVRIQKKSVDLRVSTLPTIYGDRVVLRVLETNLRDQAQARQRLVPVRDPREGRSIEGSGSQSPGCA